MTIGRPEPRQARNTDLKGAIAIGLDEAFTSLEEAFYNLTDEQAASFPLASRHSITTMVMHVLENLDTYAVMFQTGRLALEHDKRFDVWRIAEGELPAPTDNLPTVATMLERLYALRKAVDAALEPAGRGDLLGPRHAPDWWRDKGRTAADAYMRTIWHTMAHVRQIWLLRGAMGLTDKEGWPEQHWA